MISLWRSYPWDLIHEPLASADFAQTGFTFLDFQILCRYELLRVIVHLCSISCTCFSVDVVVYGILILFRISLCEITVLTNLTNHFWFLLLWINGEYSLRVLQHPTLWVWSPCPIFEQWREENLCSGREGSTTIEGNRVFQVAILSLVYVACSTQGPDW